jgi:demethylmenaquinone methyltransferase/2-methoxy-6-polyprenyl-1,4-benzoquinol methylase
MTADPHSRPGYTHFGYEAVPDSEKVKRVRQVFDSVADKYDLMNDVMSFGLHRLWKRFTVDLCQLHKGDRVLDLAGGTGDLARRMAPLLGDNGELVVSDINSSMLSIGRDHLIDAGISRNAWYVQANAEILPFPDNHFDVITIGFGLRNVTDKHAALRSMYHCLRPGGRLLILEFSKPVLPGLDKLYDLYSFSLLPKMGKAIADDEASYRYLAESIRMHPDQETLKTMMQEAGFEHCQVYNLAGGIVAVHRGFKF